ncbi:BgMsFReDn4 [Biomphalaria glabrata]|uniref:Microfibril-associated glycoprotein 4-like n=1 Tax=Biomphalaria glabrata TaxID=6526 RepID=A0A9U8EHD4_BIOGL|nr:microfibril-associated glycoprotein 4-like [Biomphalaria glabrata]KAI8750936.1 Microfibril-associated glycoprotein 4-like Resistant factor [Biomphalaria glabrata]KAI8772240.1 BgiBsFReDn4 [Biomphalaria glabrata]
MTASIWISLFVILLSSDYMKTAVTEQILIDTSKLNLKCTCTIDNTAPGPGTTSGPGTTTGPDATPGPGTTIRLDTTSGTGTTSGPRVADSCDDVTDSVQSKVIVQLPNGLEVMCDTETDGGGWTVIQRRHNGMLNFYRGWEDYKHGFGDYSNGEFYLGNEMIHRLTANGTYELRIDIDYKQGRFHAQYSRFSLSGESEGYKLQYSGYSGNAGDSLAHQNNNKFSTFDKDLDNYSIGNCAVLYRGGWWYNACHDSNLNGVWGSKDYGKGVNWMSVTTLNDSASRTEIKIRKARK